MNFSFRKSKAAGLFLKLLKQGASPERLALSAALGVSLGIFPVFGVTSFLCIIAALILRLNQAAILAVNFVVYPLWIIMLVPFFKIGKYVFNARRIPFASPDEIIAMFKSDGFHFFQTFGAAVFHASVAWLIISPVIGAAIYFAVLPVLRKHLHSGTQIL